MFYSEYIAKNKEMAQTIALYEAEIKETKKAYSKKHSDELKIKLDSLKNELEVLKNESEDLNASLINIIEFKVDSYLKREYLRQKPFSTAKADLPTFVAVDEYEELLEKQVYNFSLADRDEMMMMKFKNTTIGTVHSTASKIKGYIDFCVRQGAVIHNQNIFDTFIKSEASKFVSKQATEFRYITKERLKEYQDILVNPQDKLLLVLPYIGVRGRTIKGGTLEEIINLKLDLDSEETKKNILILERNDGTHTELTVTEEIMNLVKDTYNQTEYISNNGATDGSSKEYRINRYKNYVFCSVGSTKLGTLNPVTINARLQKIQNYCNNQYITVYNLFMSGMITKALEIYSEKGEITNSDYIDICFQFKYGEVPEKYMSKVKYEVETYLKGGILNA